MLTDKVASNSFAENRGAAQPFAKLAGFRPFARQPGDGSIRRDRLFLGKAVGRACARLADRKCAELIPLSRFKLCGAARPFADDNLSGKAGFYLAGTEAAVSGKDANPLFPCQVGCGPMAIETDMLRADQDSPGPGFKKNRAAGAGAGCCDPFDLSRRRALTLRQAFESLHNRAAAPLLVLPGVAVAVTADLVAVDTDARLTFTKNHLAALAAAAGFDARHLRMCSDLGRQL